MESENDLEPPAESCLDGIGFYELRPYFAATHYGRDSLPAGMALHMEHCPACRERWQFLIETDPRASADYWKEVEALVAELAANEQAGDLPEFTPVREAIVDLIRSEGAPTFEQVQAAWLAVKALADDTERESAGGELEAFSLYLLDRIGKESCILPYLMKLDKLTGSTPVRIPLDEELGIDQPVIALLILSSVRHTSFIREYPILEFDRNGGLFYPDQFLQAKALYEQRSKEAVRR